MAMTVKELVDTLNALPDNTLPVMLTWEGVVRPCVPEAIVLEQYKDVDVLMIDAEQDGLRRER